MKFNKLYEAYYDVVYRYVYSRTSNLHDTEDIVSDVFLGIWKALKTIEFDFIGEDPTKNDVPKSWIYGVVKNKLNDYLRKKYKFFANFSSLDQEYFESLPGNQTEGETELSKDSANSNEYHVVLEELIKKLGERDKLFVELRFRKDYKLVEIAKELNISLNNTKVIQNRLISKLKNLWETYQQSN